MLFRSLIFPPLTEERRVSLTKQVKKYGEEAKTATRNIRRDAMEYFKNLKKRVRFIAENNIENPVEIQKFDRLGYSFRSDLSSDSEYVFERKIK